MKTTTMATLNDTLLISILSAILNMTDSSNMNNSLKSDFISANASNSKTNNTSHKIHYLEEYLHYLYGLNIVVPVVYGLIFLLGLVGNTIVILVVVLDKTMRTTTNILILMLAVADLFFVILGLPFNAASFVLEYWPFGAAWCRIVWYLNSFSVYASVYTLVLMSLDRYLAVVHPLSSRRFRNGRNTWLAVCIVWVVIGAANIPILFQYGVEEYQFNDEMRSMCIDVLAYEEPYWGVVSDVCFLVFGYVLPLGAVCVMYGFVVRRLRAAAPGDTDRSAESRRMRQRVTKLVIVVVLVFALCWLPYQAMAFAVLVTTIEATIIKLYMDIFCLCLGYMNSCVNPIIYAFQFGNIRRTFKKVFCCK